MSDPRNKRFNRIGIIDKSDELIVGSNMETERMGICGNRQSRRIELDHETQIRSAI